MTEKQIEKMKKYVELIRKCAVKSAEVYWTDETIRYEALTDYIITRMEREMKRGDDKYQELLYAVETKYANETRHETALRYIRQVEMEAKTGVGTNAEMKR